MLYTHVPPQQTYSTLFIKKNKGFLKNSKCYLGLELSASKYYNNLFFS